VVLCRAGVSAVDAEMTEKAVSEMEYFRLAILRKALLMALVKDFTTRLARFGVIFLIKAVSETGADIFNFLASSFNAFNHILSFLIANTTSPAVEGSGRLRVAFIRLDRLRCALCNCFARHFFFSFHNACLK